MFNGGLWTVKERSGRNTGIMTMRLMPDDETATRGVKVSVRPECFSGGIEQLVADPEPDTAHSVHDPQVWGDTVELAAQVREVNVDDVRVTHPVRAPHRLEQIGA